MVERPESEHSMNALKERVQQASMKPVEISDGQLNELREAEKALTKDTREFLAEWEKPLMVDKNGYITQGVYWINAEFVTDFWSNRRKKPKAAACTCACGNKHKSKTVHTAA